MTKRQILILEAVLLAIGAAIIVCVIQKGGDVDSIGEPLETSDGRITIALYKLTKGDVAPPDVAEVLSGFEFELGAGESLTVTGITGPVGVGAGGEGFGDAD